MAEIQRRVMDIVWAYNSQDDLCLWHTHTEPLPLNVCLLEVKDPYSMCARADS